MGERLLMAAGRVVTLPAPVRGWRQASRVRRVLAVLAVPVVAGWGVASVWAPVPLWSVADGAVGVAVLVVYLVIGPTVCFALARVLRPYPHDPDDPEGPEGPSSVEGERLVRHVLAAAGAAYGLPLLALNFADPHVLAPWYRDFGTVYDQQGEPQSGPGGDAQFIALYFCTGLAAAGLGLLTSVWGIVALLGRVAGVGWAAARAHRLSPAGDVTT